MDEIRIGDTVIVREWDDMAEEYGCYHAGGAIKTPRFAFLKSMRRFCGREHVVIDTHYCCDGVFVLYDEATTDHRSLYFTADTLIKIDERGEACVSNDNFNIEELF